ncbi:MAG: glycosyltransferase family 4 protein [Ardenticatenaceae bacterium]|nr:glycosyltransferase family 4 protein [Ardenticatenaceae bacterium]
MRKRYVLDARTATDHFPGIGRYVSQLARHLVPQLAAGEELLLLHNPQAHSGWPLPPLQANVTWVETAVSPFSTAQQWQIPRLLRQLNATVYHSAYSLMPYRPGIPTLLTLYDVIPEQFPQLVSPQARLLARLTTWLALYTGNHFLAISEATRQEFLARYALKPEQVSTVLLAADEQFKPQPETAVTALRHKLNLPESYVLYLGINKPHKNLARLVDAWAMVVRELSGAPPLLIAGRWDLRYEMVKTAVTQHNLQNHIRFLGPVDDADLPALYSGARLFVFPSLVEGFGLPVLEAMACGTAVACAQTSSLPEVGGEAAAYFDPTDSTAIAQALLALLPHSAKLDEMAKRGLIQASNFSWEETAVATLTHYRRLAQ